MMKLPMTPLHPNLKPPTGLEQGDRFLDFHEGILARVGAHLKPLQFCGLTGKKV